MTLCLPDCTFVWVCTSVFMCVGVYMCASCIEMSGVCHSVCVYVSNVCVDVCCYACMHVMCAWMCVFMYVCICVIGVYCSEMGCDVNVM